MKRIVILLTIIILTLPMWAKAQIKRVGESYTLTHTKTTIAASNQNWNITKDKRGIMYFANTSGVLIFDGSNWNLLKTKTGAAVRSVASDTSTNTIYIGANGDFGKLVNNPLTNSYEYQSLDSLIPPDHKNISTIGKIVITENEGIIFAASSSIYILKNDTINVISKENDNTFIRVFNTGEHVFVTSEKLGIKELKNGKYIDLPHLDGAGNNISFIDATRDRITMLSYDSGDKGGFYFYQNDTLIHAKDVLKNFNLGEIYCGLKTHDGNYIFGTKAQGIIVVDQNFNFIKTVAINDQITNLFEDDNHLIWAATTNGIALTDIYSPFSWFPNEVTGIEGSIKSILQVKDELYIGANTLFHINIDSLNKPLFKEIANDKGQQSIWSLDTIKGMIVGGSSRGLISIDTNNILRNIDKTTTRSIRNFIIPRENPNVLIGTSSYGLSTYEYKNGQWEYYSPVNGFNKHVKHISQDDDGTVVVSDRTTGFFRIHFNESFDSVLSYKAYDTVNGFPDNFNNYIFNTGNGLTAGTIDGFYKYNSDSDKYVEDTQLNTAFGGKKVFDIMYNDHLGNLWVRHVVTDKRDKNINYWFLECYTMLGDTVAKKQYDIFRPYMSRINSFGYIGNGCYIIGDKDGFVHYDTRIDKDFHRPYNALIRRIENIYNDTLIYGGNEINDKIVLPYEQRNLRVIFSATTYEYPEEIKFKSFLEGNDDEWSDFRSENYKEYPNLRPGKYILHVKAINCYDVESQEATITFQILAPWYLTKLAIVLYFALFALAIWLFVKAYTKKLIRDKEKLEKIVEERTAEIRKQSQLILEKNEEITAKNKEITDSIRYAQRIQTAMLPMEEKIQSALPEHFILFRPKDIVSGDYYWFAETEKSIIITAADCTGHGVPGAFMSMIGSQILTEIVVEGITSPEEILTNQNRRIRKALKQDTTANQDGMDMALCTIDKKTHLVEYSGAKNQLVVIQNDELTEYKADKQSIGGQQLYGADFQYKKVAIQPDGNTWFYMFSDGYKDQFGGENNTKFLIKNLRALFMQIHNEPPAKQREILNDTIEKWIKDGNTEQTDDIIIIGFKC
ncbi:MAG: SpoIIE family protein phosphatase [Bacteroidales bacterium]|nr:SpoIIE family protein phosphatase [Bacteroidales bacterium]